MTMSFKKIIIISFEEIDNILINVLISIIIEVHIIKAIVGELVIKR